MIGETFAPISRCIPQFDGVYTAFMGEYSHYTRAPLTEAVLDIALVTRDGLTAEELSAIFPDMELRYPHRTEIKFVTAMIEFSPTTIPAPSMPMLLGYRFQSPDSKDHVQVRINGFTVNRLAPYTGWEHFAKEARELWGLYRTIAQPQSIGRVALRYINRIDIPKPTISLADYFHTYPAVPDGLPSPVKGFFLQTTLGFDDIKSAVTITQTHAQSNVADTSSIILDIDLFRIEDIPVDEESLWRVFDELRSKKNRIFEECITDKTRELIL
jgi:uncharacterized protein (TIGR04255 family)